MNAWVKEKRKGEMNICQMADQEGWDRKENRAWDINVSSDLKAAVLFLSGQVGSYSPLSLHTEGKYTSKHRSSKDSVLGKSCGCERWATQRKHCDI